MPAGLSKILVRIASNFPIIVGIKFCLIIANLKNKPKLVCFKTYVRNKRNHNRKKHVMYFPSLDLYRIVLVCM